MIFYLTNKYIFKHLKLFFLVNYIFEIWYILYVTAHLWLATFQVFHSYMWLVVTKLDSAGIVVGVFYTHMTTQIFL